VFFYAAKVQIIFRIFAENKLFSTFFYSAIIPVRDFLYLCRDSEVLFNKNYKQNGKL